MIAGFLKNNHLGATILIPLLGIFLWVTVFFKAEPAPAFYGMPLFQLFDEALKNLPVLKEILALALILAEAFFLNQLAVSHQGTPKANFLPAAIYLLLMSSSRSFLSFHPLLFANFFLLLAIRSLLKMHKKETAFAEAFDGGFYIAIASLFYLPALLFFPFLGLSFLIMRPFIWREWIIALFGLVVPYLFTAVYYFWIGDLFYLWDNRLQFTFEGKIQNMNIPSSNILFVVMFCILIGLGLLVLFSTVANLSLKARSTTHILFWFLVFSAGIIIASPEYKAPYTAFLFIPAAVIIGNFLLQIKKNFWSELLFFSLVFSVVYNILVR